MKRLLALGAVLLIIAAGNVNAEIIDERGFLVIDQVLTLHRKDTTTSSTIPCGGYPYMTVGLYSTQANDSVYCDSILILTSDVDTVGTAIKSTNSAGSVAYTNFYPAYNIANRWHRKSVELPPSKYAWVRFQNVNTANGPNTKIQLRVFLGP